jgi:hypothetical protein
MQTKKALAYAPGLFSSTSSIAGGMELLRQESKDGFGAKAILGNSLRGAGELIG